MSFWDWLFLIMFLVLLRVLIVLDRRWKIGKARREADKPFNPPNVHGAAGEADKKDAKNKGWI